MWRKTQYVKKGPGKSKRVESEFGHVSKVRSGGNIGGARTEGVAPRVKKNGAEARDA